MKISHKKELEDLIKLHDILKDTEDFYYASYIKDQIRVIKRRLREATKKEVKE